MTEMVKVPLEVIAMINLEKDMENASLRRQLHERDELIKRLQETQSQKKDKQ